MFASQKFQVVSEPTEERPRTLVEDAYLRLREDIIQGKYESGSRLRVEHMKDDYGVGAGTLREALSLLVSDSLVIAEGQRGFSVAPLSLADLDDLTHTRILLETDALRLSLRHGGDDWEGQLVAAFHRLSIVEERIRRTAPHARTWAMCTWRWRSRPGTQRSPATTRPMPVCITSCSWHGRFRPRPARLAVLRKTVE